MFFSLTPISTNHSRPYHSLKVFLFPTQIRVGSMRIFGIVSFITYPAISTQFEYKNMLSRPVFFTVPMSQHLKPQKYGFDEY